MNVPDAFRLSPHTTGIFLDFDGSLSEIVARPELAVAAPGTREVLAALADTFQLVAVVSGRPSAEVRERLAIPGVAVLGLYGLEEDAGAPRAVSVQGRQELLADVRRCMEAVPGSRLEDKGPSLAVHVRGVPDPGAAAVRLRDGLAEVAERHGMVVLHGKMVLELAPADTPGKGALVMREALSRGLTAVLYAGDDHADLDAFAAVERLSAQGVAGIKVAVGGAETPPELLAAADVSVDGPGGLVALLRGLLPAG